MNTKKTAFGIAGAAAAGLLTLGLAAPAMASAPHHDGGGSTSTSRTTQTSLRDLTSTTSNVAKYLNDNTVSTPVVVSPSVNVGDVASGNAVGSGNTTDIPVLSGNDTALLSGNTTNTGNGTSVLNGSGNGNSASNSQANGSGNANGSANSSSNSVTTGQIGDNVNQTVDQTVNQILGGLGLSSGSGDGGWH